MAICVMAGCRGAVPMLLARGDPGDIARPNLLNRASPALRQPAPCGHDECLAQRVGVPCRSSTGFKRDAGAECASRRVCLEQGIDPYRAGKILGKSIARRLRTTFPDVHRDDSLSRS